MHFAPTCRADPLRLKVQHLGRLVIDIALELHHGTGRFRLTGQVERGISGLISIARRIDGTP